MQYLGFFLVFLALVALLFGLLQHLKGKKILAAPFSKTGEIAQNPASPTRRASSSCEGAVQAQQPAIAPCSGTPCVYFEVEVVQRLDEARHRPRTARRPRRARTRSRRSSPAPCSSSTTAPVPSRSTRARAWTSSSTRASSRQQNVSHGDVMFGQFHTHVPHAGGDKHGSGVKVIEKIVPVAGRHVRHGSAREPDASRSRRACSVTLRASRKGRAALLGATKRNSMIGFIAGGLMVLPGAGLSIFADRPSRSRRAKARATSSISRSRTSGAAARSTDDDGSNVPLTVTQAGTFEINGGPPRGKKIPVIASIGVKDEAGKSLVADAHEHASLDLQPRQVHDQHQGHDPGRRRALQGRLQLRAHREAHGAAHDARRRRRGVGDTERERERARRRGRQPREAGGEGSGRGREAGRRKTGSRGVR